MLVCPPHYGKLLYAALLTQGFRISNSVTDTQHADINRIRQ